MLGDVAGGGGDPGGRGSDVYGGVVLLGGHWWVLCASPSWRIMVVAFFRIGGGDRRFIVGSVVSGGLLFCH
jgi:hypothetical protein